MPRYINDYPWILLSDKVLGVGYTKADALETAKKEYEIFESSDDMYEYETQTGNRKTALLIRCHEDLFDDVCDACEEPNELESYPFDERAEIGTGIYNGETFDLAQMV